MSRKSQITVLDLFISFGMASLLVVFIVLGWNSYTNLLARGQREKFIELQAMQTLDLLIKSPGEPVDWEKNIASSEVFGLAMSDRNISQKKLDALSLSSYNQTSRMLGIDLVDFQLLVRHMNGTELFRYGKALPANKPVITLQRLAGHQNTTATVEIAMWE